MKKLSLGFGVAVAIFVSTSCFAQVSTSGIDLNNSRLDISYWKPSNPAYQLMGNSAKCLGGTMNLLACGLVGDPTTNCNVPVRLSSLGMSDPSTTMEKAIDNCFQASGHYEVILTLRDNAGNTSVSDPIIFDILPTSPDGDQSQFSENCSQESTLAADGDAESVCALKLSIQDKFGNPVSQLVGNTSSFQGNVPTDAGDANEGISFLKGLRMRDGVTWKEFPDTESLPQNLNNNISTDPSWGVTASFEVGSIAPSLRKVGPAAEGAEGAATLSEVVPIPVDFTLSLPTIDKDGTVLSEPLVPTQSRAYLQFLPPFEIFPTIRGEDGFVQVSIPKDPDMLNGNDPIDWEDKYPVELKFPIQQYDTTAWDAQSLTKISNLSLGNDSVSGVRMANGSLGTVLAESDFEDFTGLVYPSPFNNGTNPDGLTSTHITETPQPDPTNITLGVGAILSYDIVDPLPAGGTKTVAYAAGGVGSRNDFWNEDTAPGEAENLVGYHYSPDAQVIGAHVVGGILGTSSQLTVDVHGETSSVIQQSSFDDLRAKITENAYRLRRGADDAYILNTTLIGADELQLFDSTDVLIVDAGGADVNVSLSYGIMPEGNNTLIIFDGNLVIPQNLEYQNATDSMGFMVINSDLAQGGGQDTLTERRDTGNIWIKNSADLRRIVGTYFADGGIMSMPQSKNNVMAGNTDDATSDRSAQLLLTGALYTRNTLGGSNQNNEAGRFFDPWGEATQDDAKIYDLHEVRTYNHVDLPDNPPITEEYDHVDFCVRKLDEPTECIDNCEEKPDANVADSTTTECYASFVIQLDRKVSNPTTTPPGFEVQSSISR